MSATTEIHIADGSGRQTIHTEDEARSLWSTGAISRAAFYWQAGMADWRPVAEFFEPSAVPSLPVPQAAAPRWAKDSTTLTRVLVVLFWLQLGCGVVGAIVSGVGLGTGRLPSPEDELTAIDVIQLLVGLVQVGLMLTTVVAFCMWVYRANLNARALGAQGLTFTPGWSVGWFFIPIAHLWKPYQAMRQIWQASRNPAAWLAEVPPAFIGAWWGLWLFSNFLGQMTLRLSLRGPAMAQASEVCSLVSDVVDIPLCLLAMRVVKSIYELQRARTAAP